MTPEKFGEVCPEIYHMSEEGSWPSIRTLGLLSTTALLDLFDINGEQRKKIELQHRPSQVEVAHPEYGSAVIRDQKPLSDSKLRGCLEDGISTEEWYQMLNRKVFFWATRERLDRLLSARAYRAARHTVLTIDGARLAEDYSERLALTTMNTGTTAPIAHPRGRSSFTPLADFDYAASRRKRGRQRAIAEVAADYQVRNVEEYVLKVTHEGAGEPPEIVFQVNEEK